jgi:peptidoglycan hydrolase-like protein with peptidoglycan-binding domain
MTRRPPRLAAGATALVVLAALTGCSVDAGSGAAAASSSAPPTTAAASPAPGTTTSTPPTTPSPAGSPTETPTSTPTPSASRTPTESPSPTPSATPTPVPRTTLVLGDSGDRVQALQKRLSELGYWLGDVDGRFGPLTQQAVYALQKTARITRDGIVGPNTLRALEQGVRPSASIGTGIEVDLGRQVLLVVRGGKVTLALNTSTGNGEPYTTTFGTPAIAHTPTGTYTFQRRVDGMAESSLGKLWRPVFFTSTGYAVHGSSSVPPWPASHGCVRVSNAAIDMIWARGLAPIGSTITIH